MKHPKKHRKNVVSLSESLARQQHRKDRAAHARIINLPLMQRLKYCWKVVFKRPLERI